MKCPKCGYQRIKADQDKPKSYCPSCGVIYTKAQAALLKKVASQQKAKEEELQRREQELKKREVILQDQSSPVPKPGKQNPTQPQPTNTNTSTKPKKETAPLQPKSKGSSCLGYFFFVVLGIPGLFIFGGGIEEGVWGYLGQTILGFVLFFGTFVLLPPVQKYQDQVAKVIAIGIVGGVGIFCVVFLKSCFAPMPVDIENGIAKRDIIVSPRYKAGIIADTINNQACQIVEENSGIKGVKLTVYLDGDSVSDKYGNKAGANLYMGTVDVSDLTEVRKYKSCSDYSYAMKSKTVAKVLSMSNTRLLRR